MYEAVFLAAVALTLLASCAAHTKSRSESSPPPRSFTEFQRIYLLVYYLAIASDWLQGPYVYALYSAYGFSRQDIAQLFVAGFGSSFLFGTFVGGLADQQGRKRWAMLYTVTYGMSCLTKHFRDYWVLMMGRVLGGVATSLLFSVFDSWMVSEHMSQQFHPDLLARTFSLAMLGNSIVAIVSGVVAQWVSEISSLEAVGDSILHVGGYTAPFDVAMLCLILAFGLMHTTWRENRGSSDSTSALSVSALKSAWNLILSNQNILMIGLIQSLFEGSMYTFVFMWTPALSSSDEPPPHGVIFATFMVCCMMGTSIFNLYSIPCHTLLWQPLLVSFLAFIVPSISTDTTLIYLSFLVFEICVGMYFPCIGTIKGECVPEESRAAVYNLFRVPLNVIVVAVLLNNLSVPMSMACCVVMLGVATILAWIIRTRTMVVPIPNEQLPLYAS